MSKNKRKIQWLLSLLLLGSGLFSLSAEHTPDPVPAVTKYYDQQLDSLRLVVYAMESEAMTAPPDTLRSRFLTARTYYKHMEALVAYHLPETAQMINGPNLPEAEMSEPQDVHHPSGFQVLEEVLFDPGRFDRSAVYSEISGLRFAVDRLTRHRREVEVSASTILDALKLNVYRLITMGITGFDSPVILNSVPEAAATLESAVAILRCFPNSEPVVAAATEALMYLQTSAASFGTFDRAGFIVDYINPLCMALHQFQSDLHIPYRSSPPRAVAAHVPTLFSEGAFNVLFYAPAGTEPATEAQIALGKRLFFTPDLSIDGKRSCSSCHDPAKAFTDGLKTNESLLDTRRLLRNTPTIINAALQPVQFYDSRIAFLEDQAHDVIANPDEMGGVFPVIVEKMQRGAGYRQAFKDAFGSRQITGRRIRQALAAYVRSLVRMNSPFDRYMRGDKNAMTEEAVAGFNLFMGKAKCGTCHFMPLFNGTVPPLFGKMESEVLGVPAFADLQNAVLDADSGKYRLYAIPHHLFSFKTTSVRNVAYTAPYMHNGVFATLEEVIEFYDLGGGVGLGMDIPNQTLPPDPLHLEAEEKQALIAFLHALSDTSATHSEMPAANHLTTAREGADR